MRGWLSAGSYLACGKHFCYLWCRDVVEYLLRAMQAQGARKQHQRKSNGSVGLVPQVFAAALRCSEGPSTLGTHVRTHCVNTYTVSVAYSVLLDVFLRYCTHTAHAHRTRVSPWIKPQ